MSMKYIDRKNWPRASQFEFFLGFQQPFFDVCARVDVTGLRQRTRQNQESLFANMLYESMAALHEVPELRQRIRGDQVVEHEFVHPNFTVLNQEDVVNFCTAQYQPDRKAFMEEVAWRSVATRTQNELYIVEEAERDDLVFVTSLPWLDFQAIRHPFAGTEPRHGVFIDSIPRLAWGKFVEMNGRVTTSVQITVHHSLADGLHAARFFAALEARTQPL